MTLHRSDRSPGDCPEQAEKAPEQPERGAVLVEFALVLPVLALILFGIIEFGWAYSQNLDVRHGARETARLAVVDFDDGDPTTTMTEGLVAEACSRMDSALDTTVSLAAPTQTTGGYVTVTITRQFTSLTGFVDFALPTELTSEVKMRLERDATWVSGSYACPQAAVTPTTVATP